MATIDERLSAFPEGLDQFNEVFDLPHGMYDKAARLTELKNKASLNSGEQDELIQLTSELHMYLITPQAWNKFGSALYSVQKFFNSNVRGFIEDKQKIWDSYIKQFLFVGRWVSGKSYKFQNMVTDANGDLYLCKKDHVSVVSQPPTTNTTYWVKLSSKGEKGDVGLNATFRGEWNTSTQYALGDAVVVGGNSINGGLVYIAKRQNTGRNPGTSLDDWVLYNNLYVGPTPPANAGTGVHFIEVLD
ncbi:TPA: hypothetical protein ACGO1T_000554 [Streptococcus suis]